MPTMLGAWHELPCPGLCAILYQVSPLWWQALAMSVLHRQLPVKHL